MNYTLSSDLVCYVPVGVFFSCGYMPKPLILPVPIINVVAVVDRANVRERTTKIWDNECFFIPMYSVDQDKRIKLKLLIFQLIIEIL